MKSGSVRTETETSASVSEKAGRMNQKTIDREVELSGQGIHTGVEARVVFRPAPPDSGISFVRVDQENDPVIPAVVENVKSAERGTTLSLGGIDVRTVEHLLAAVKASEIDNLIVEIDANEVPACDGSCLSFFEILRGAGVREQERPRNIYRLKKSFYYAEDGVNFLLLPSDEFKVSFHIEFVGTFIGSQFASVVVTPENFRNELASARTFCFLEDVDRLKEEGLIKGGSLQNAVVVTEDGIVNEEPLRFHNEFVRHKIVDLIGDLSLLGTNLTAHVISSRSGHPSNVELVRRLFAMINDETQTAVRVKRSKSLDIVDIQKILPHRYPFLLVDRILELEEGKRAVGIKNVSYNEFFFQGHFPGHPVMPGVLCIEAMGQVGGVLLMNSVPEPENKLVYFIALDKVKFRKPIRPGDVIRFELNMMKIRDRTCKMRGEAFVDGEIVAEAKMVAMVVDK